MSADPSQPAVLHQRHTWRRTLAVWAITTAALLVVALVVSAVFVRARLSQLSIAQLSGNVHVFWTDKMYIRGREFSSEWRGPMGLGRIPRCERRSPVNSLDHSVEVSVPLWLLVLLGGGVAAFAWRFLPRRARGLCPCGYSLAGLSPGAVCPECGRLSPRRGDGL